MRYNLQYKYISKEDRELSNGCGASYWLIWIFRLPRWLFPEINKACDCHDLGYRTGGPIEDKWAYDAQLVEDIRDIADRSNPIVRLYKRGIANLVESALNTCMSIKAWNYANIKR